MVWTVLNFGKYQGKSLPQILFTDPDWFFWAMGEGVFAKKSASLKMEAEAIWEKAQRIRIPPSQPAGSEVEYVIHSGVNKLSSVEVVPPGRPPHLGSSPTIRRDEFDLSVARGIAKYDKFGGKVLVKAIKHYWFGSESARLTRQRCEAFFADPDHFA